MPTELEQLRKKVKRLEKLIRKAAEFCEAEAPDGFPFHHELAKKLRKALES
jgi:hypothetical protein